MSKMSCMLYGRHLSGTCWRPASSKVVQVGAGVNMKHRLSCSISFMLMLEGIRGLRRPGSRSSSRKEEKGGCGSPPWIQ